MTAAMGRAATATFSGLVEYIVLLVFYTHVCVCGFGPLPKRLSMKALYCALGIVHVMLILPP